jgi:diacylglycerol kinase family enzyme
MNCFIIINQHSRNGRSGKKTRELFALLESSGITFSHAITESLDHARQLSLKANREGADTIVAVGGDGTINRVLRGFYDAAGHRTSRAKMGVIHTGTSPDFCKSYGIPRSLPQAVQSIRAGVTSLVRIGMIQCRVSPGQPSGPLFFGCCANIGLGASLARAANGGIRKYFGDTAGTLLSLILILLRYRPVPVSLSIDGRQREINRMYDIAVGRTRHIASGIKVQHTLGPLDPRLYAVAVRNLSPFNLIPVLSILYGAKPIPPDRGDISLDYGSRIEIIGDSSIEVECDGDPAGYCPCAITTTPDPLELIVGGADAR